MPTNKAVDKFAILKTYFGYDAFRGGQEELIDGILAGKDVLGIMPTGAGKSLCYQIPALLLDGVTVVVSPLISLMNDQVRSLNKAGIRAAYINSSLTESQVSKVMRQTEDGAYKIVYVAPERLETEWFRRVVEKLTIPLVAVDEAHCVSQWGQDFRKSYLEISAFVDSFPKRPIVAAFTATATDLVRQDIIRLLDLHEPQVTATGFDRPNLFFDVRHSKQRLREVIAYVKEHRDVSGIIYCATRKNVEQVHEELWKAGISAARYHAGIGNEERKKSQDDFIYDRVNVIVATNAFGMGIDKSNVRYVLHYNMPQSLENYYQEAGRAGRDGEPAECILFFRKQDVVINRLLLSHKDNEEFLEDGQEIDQYDEYRLRQMERYACTADCLRGTILKYFGQDVEQENCGNCGNCTGEFEVVDMTEQAKQGINCIYETRQRFGVKKIVAILRGSKAKWIQDNRYENLRTYGVLAEESEAELLQMFERLLFEGYLAATQDRYQVLKLTNRIKELNERPLVVRRSTKRQTEADRQGKTRQKQSRASLDERGQNLFERLRALRMEIAKEEKIPPYIVFSDKTLVQMCILLPSNRDEMLAVSGVGVRKWEAYGKRFLQVVQRFRKEQDGHI